MTSSKNKCRIDRDEHVSRLLYLSANKPDRLPKFFHNRYGQRQRRSQAKSQRPLHPYACSVPPDEFGGVYFRGRAKPRQNFESTPAHQRQSLPPGRQPLHLIGSGRRNPFPYVRQIPGRDGTWQKSDPEVVMMWLAPDIRKMITCRHIKP